MSYQHLTFDERNVIYRMEILGQANAEIARCLGRHVGTIGREVRRNAEWDGRYFSASAQAFTHARRRAHIRRPKTGDDKLMAFVADRLERCWSPQQIAGRLREVGSATLPNATISHTTIYHWIWACPGGPNGSSRTCVWPASRAENPMENRPNAGRSPDG